ncbi:hypothetical protein CF386_11625 [Paraphotobacterium marinum]|uniref:Nucleoprotein/polynucleotide-associated enzyme n=1 Tax=Paraphotobacterium marinum TaxID=1755811 RepID=A0A220VHG3_9GAMM|nr:DUF2058 domain-containing protein [Paraphotobacterium marinum]ASK79690.1 hypothetical protein CF386_11625 [Paraphotobacterium marinum]
MAKLTLQEQMLKAGLVDKKKLKKTAKKSKKSRDMIRETRENIATNKAAQVEKDKLLNEKRAEELRNKEIENQINQLILSNKIKNYSGEIEYNFQSENLIKTLYVNDMIKNHLISGKLAIAKLKESYEIIPSPVAHKIQEINSSKIVLNNVNNHSESEQDDDDYYAQFEIPDDLMW